jgi:hypothetical protein
MSMSEMPVKPIRGGADRLSSEERRKRYQERKAAETPEQAEQRRAAGREAMRRHRANNPGKDAAAQKQRNERISEERRERRADPEWQDGRRRASEDAGPLRRRIDMEALENRASLDDLTVMAPFNDAYRFDTPAGHRDAAWFKEHLDLAGAGRIHLRGFHYRLVARGDITLPNGKIRKL